MEFITENLNQQQKQAVIDDSGPLLVIAGPGSGKTHMLTRRIARIILETKGDKFKVLALTFTTKAANEMKERVEQLVGEEVNRLFISTFHGFCFEVLRKYGSYIGLNKEFTIYDNSSTTNDYIGILIEAVQEELEREDSTSYYLLSKYEDQQLLRNDAQKYLNGIARMKNQLRGPRDIPKNSKKYDITFQIIYKLYDNKLRSNNAIDYGDLLFLAFKLFKEKPFIAKQYRKVFKHLLIDEAQDTNKAQFQLIKAFCGDNYQNIFIVADEDQLIYEWNDARFEHLLEFVKLYNAKTIQMFENYRCPKPVLQMANQLIKLNVNRLDTKEELRANIDGDGQEVTFNKYEYPEDESVNVTQEISKINEFTSTCIIARNRFVLKRLEKNLKKAGIPYNYPSSNERFLTKEANMTVAILHAAFNEEDKVHINLLCDYFSLNADDLFNLKDQTLFSSFIEAISEIEPKLSKTLKKLINSKLYFVDYIENIFKDLANDNLLERDILEENRNLKDDFTHFRSVIRLYKRDRDEEERNIGDFLSFMALLPKGNQSEEGVTLLTGHAAKGLEFKYVFIVSLNQGIFPDFRSINNLRTLEEERRNFFVAMTRTKKKLYLSYTENMKTRYGYREQQPSQFLGEIGLL
ncbi:AAA family ATPase [Halobacillus halophilus]|uniref:ATP-dependent helicase n=1 Tax=Halobacillus halophilus TaxID=1570 RepID=UPI001368F3F6|nr:ATP-dependent helicase [Halobacillus halophilus]MYL29881.1 AAA family ATPase [Halobacillus halophilus]